MPYLSNPNPHLEKEECCSHPNEENQTERRPTEMEILASHPTLRLIACCEQYLQNVYNRRLIVLERKPRPQSRSRSQPRPRPRPRDVDVDVVDVVDEARDDEEGEARETEAAKKHADLLRSAVFTVDKLREIVYAKKEERLAMGFSGVIPSGRGKTV